MEEKEEYYSTNNVAGVNRGLSVLIFIIGVGASIFGGLAGGDIIISVIGAVVSILATLILFTISEVIQIMHDIRKNTEFLRDYIESEKK